MRTLLHIAMIIPHRMLRPETLRGGLEAFVMREGTDSGAQDVPRATTVLQVRQQLDAGTAVLVSPVFPLLSLSCNTRLAYTVRTSPRRHEAAGAHVGPIALQS